MIPLHVKWLHELLHDLVDGLRDYPRLSDKAARQALHRRRLLTMLKTYDRH